MNNFYLKNFFKLSYRYFKGDIFFNFRLFDKKVSTKLDNSIFKTSWDGLFAIVIQGQLIDKFNFTLETIKLYRYFYPNAILIFSTWHLDKHILETLKDLNVHVIQNKLPKFNGISNINLQIITSQSGIFLAKKLGAEYVLKTRSDQRIYHPSFASYLYSLIDTFPLKNNICIQKKRIIGLSLNTFKFRLYGLSDHFIFGHINDLILYFDVELDDRRFTSNDIFILSPTLREYSKLCICEVYLCTNFLKKIGRTLTFELSDSFEMFRDHFLIIDHNAIKLFWNKYTLDLDRFNYLGIYEPEVSFNDWLILINTDKMEKVEDAFIDELLHI